MTEALLGDQGERLRRLNDWHVGLNFLGMKLCADAVVSRAAAGASWLPTLVRGAAGHARMASQSIPQVPLLLKGRFFVGPTQRGGGLSF